MYGIIGAVIGDIAGSLHESFNNPTKPKEGFKLITSASCATDDTMCTAAIANWLLTDPSNKDCLIDSLHEFCLHGHGGFGGMFSRWLKTGSREPYGSFGNGAAMRVSPVGWFGDSPEEVAALAEDSALVTHNHPDAIKSAQAVALAIYLARTGKSKEYIREHLEQFTGYDLHSKSVEELSKYYRFDCTAKGSVPHSIQCWLESDTYEETIRKAIMMGGDTDTMACIAGSIAAATPGMEVDYTLVDQAINIASWPENGNRIIDTINKFNERFVFNKTL